MGNSADAFARGVPDQTGKVVVVTGANSGLGLETCAALAGKGAVVVMACRNASKAGAARAEVVRRAKARDDQVVVAPLDLASLESVRAFRGECAKALGAERPIDVLIANAGIMAVPQREETKDGFELQMGTNCFGHFLLIAELIPLVKAAPTGRVVLLSSAMHMYAGGITFDDLDRKKRYDRWATYAETKLGDLLIMHKLTRVLRERGVDNVTVVACHPGYASTNLQVSMGVAGVVGNALFAQSAAMGATPTILAATDRDAKPGDYAGPKFLSWGAPVWGARQTRLARDEKLQDQFWDALESATHASFVGRL